MLKEKGTKEKSTKENKIGQRLSEACGERGLTFYCLARNSGVPLTTLMHIIDGSTKNPGIYTVLRLCNAMELPVSDLIEELED